MRVALPRPSSTPPPSPHPQAHSPVHAGNWKVANGRQTQAGSWEIKVKHLELGARDSDGGIDESLGRQMSFQRNRGKASSLEWWGVEM